MDIKNISSVNQAFLSIYQQSKRWKNKKQGKIKAEGKYGIILDKHIGIQI